MNAELNVFKNHLLDTMWVIWKIRSILFAKVHHNNKEVKDLFKELKENKCFQALDDEVRKTILRDLNDIFSSKNLNKEKQGEIVIKKIRKVIDILDKKILDTLYAIKNNVEEVWPLLFNDELEKLVNERFLLTNIIGRVKSEINMPVLQENRYANILKNLYKYNEKNEYGFSEEQIKTFWDDIHKESCMKQKTFA